MILLKRLILVIILSLSLTSCYKTVYKDRIVYVTPDAYYLQDCDLGKAQGSKVKDVLQLSADRLLALKNCNLDKKYLRTWKQKYDAPNR